MLVFWDQRLAVLATPKTGSTAIEAALYPLAALAVQNPPALKHTTVRAYQTHIRPYLESAARAPFTAVALMREPRDWLGSWYRTRHSDEFDEDPVSTRGMSFDAFVRGWCSDAPSPPADVGSQADFLDPGTGPGLDRIFRYDEIDSFTQFLEERLDCEVVLPRLKVSPSAEMSLSASTEALLARAGARDFALYASLAAGG